VRVRPEVRRARGAFGWTLSVPLAHFGHWWGSLIYASPVFLMAGALLYSNWKEKRRRKRS
jgi:hypothetical protein